MLVWVKMVKSVDSVKFNSYHSLKSSRENIVVYKALSDSEIKSVKKQNRPNKIAIGTIGGLTAMAGIDILFFEGRGISKIFKNIKSVVKSNHFNKPENNFKNKLFESYVIELDGNKFFVRKNKLESCIDKDGREFTNEFNSLRDFEVKDRINKIIDLVSNKNKTAMKNIDNVKIYGIEESFQKEFINNYIADAKTPAEHIIDSRGRTSLDVFNNSDGTKTMQKYRHDLGRVYEYNYDIDGNEIVSKRRDFTIPKCE